MSPLTFGVASDTGRVRDHNEDRWRIDPAAGLFVVSDGMGGAANGEMAAQFVVDFLPNYVEGSRRSQGSAATVDDTIATAVAAVSDELYNRNSAARVTGTTATVVAALIHEKSCAIAYLGDSRAYLLRDDELRCLTVDHTITQVLVEAGALAEDQVAGHPARNKLTRFAGMQPPAKPGAIHVELQPLDRMLLCSDGIYGMLSAEALHEIVGRDQSPQALCDVLVTASNHAGGHDNMTALLIDVDE